MERWNGRVALVTGASAGIGAAICRKLVKHGLIVVGCARNLQKIEDLVADELLLGYSGTMHAMKCDLEQESDILAVFSDIRSKFGRIDILINNAGMNIVAPLLSGETDDWRKIFQVNVLALCICSKEAVKLMREKNIDDGQIINISSIGGHFLPSIPNFDISSYTFYCGTKFMVRALTEGLRKEVRIAETNIRVASISPGVVETEIVEKTFGTAAVKKLYDSMKPMQPKDIADTVIYILQSPPYVEVNDIIIQPVE